MIVSPAIDLREGQCVQLVGGDYDNEIIRLPFPVVVATEWMKQGFNNLHIIDLDRATGVGNNISTVEQLCNLTRDLQNLDIRVGGGIRSGDDIDEILSFGASKIVVGTKAIREPEWFKEVVVEFPNKLFVAIEVDGRQVRVSGWQEDSEDTIEDLISRFNSLEVAGIFVTAIHHEGRRQGTDIDLFSYIRSQTEHAIVASGGITTIDDINRLSQANINEVVLGAALYKDADLVQNLAKSLQEGKYN